MCTLSDFSEFLSHSIFVKMEMEITYIFAMSSLNSSLVLLFQFGLKLLRLVTLMFKVQMNFVGTFDGNPANKYKLKVNNINSRKIMLKSNKKRHEKDITDTVLMLLVLTCWIWTCKCLLKTHFMATVHHTCSESIIIYWVYVFMYTK